TDDGTVSGFCCKGKQPLGFKQQRFRTLRQVRRDCLPIADRAHQDKHSCSCQDPTHSHLLLAERHRSGPLLSARGTIFYTTRSSVCARSCRSLRLLASIDPNLSMKGGARRGAEDGDTKQRCATPSPGGR